VPGPAVVLPLQMKAPYVLLLVQIKSKQAVNACRCQEYRLLHTADFMTVFEITVSEGILNPESAVVNK
jgi:hypothetical protein